jgi:hypothetical protein
MVVHAMLVDCALLYTAVYYYQPIAMHCRLQISSKRKLRRIRDGLMTCKKLVKLWRLSMKRNLLILLRYHYSHTVKKLYNILQSMQ